jgi:hypothetical protein
MTKIIIKKRGDPIEEKKRDDPYLEIEKSVDLIENKEIENKTIDRNNVQYTQKQKKAPNKKLLIMLSISTLVLFLYYGWYYVDYYFFSLARLGLACFDQDLAGYGIVLFLIEGFAWFIFLIFFYFGIFNILFPRIRGVNQMRSKNTYARKVTQMGILDPNYVFLKVKFTFFPLFDWYTLKIPKPTDENGIKWRRMPQSIDIQSENINLFYNEVEHLYEISNKNNVRIDDNQEYYKSKATAAIKYIGENIGNAIQGDSNMMKDYYTMNLVMDEYNEPIPKKNMKRPKSDIEKEIVDEYVHDERRTE